MTIARGDVIWMDFGSPRGSQPAKVRPAVVLQEGWLLASTISTVLVVPLTSNIALEKFPGNVLIPAVASGLESDSIGLVTQVGPVDRQFIQPHPAGHLPRYLLAELEAGVRLVLGL